MHGDIELPRHLGSPDLERHRATQQPGLHFKLPFGVDEVISVPIKRQLKLEFGFGTPGATNILRIAYV